MLARIEAVNPSVNAIVTLAAEQARAVAAGLDARAARGEFVGPLHGLVGLRTTPGLVPAVTRAPGPSRNAILPSTTPPAQPALPNSMDAAP